MLRTDKMRHMRNVACYMKERAKDYGVDPQLAEIIGFLHDIGCIECYKDHEKIGATLLRKIGASEYIAFAIEHHGENLRQLESEYGKGNEPFNVNKMLVLLVEADCSVDAKGNIVGFDKRLKDIENRYGLDSPAYKNVKDNIEYIKEYQKEISKPKKILKNERDM